MELLQVARLEQMFLQQVCVGAVVEALDVDVARDGAAVDGGAVERERAKDDELPGEQHGARRGNEQFYWIS